MMTDFDQIINRRDSDSVKWNLYPEDVLPLWVADTDFPSPPEVVEALTSRINHGLFGYAQSQEKSLLAVKAWLQARHKWEVSLDDIVLLPGVVLGFNTAARVFTNPGDSILIQTPAYHPFFEVSKNSRLLQILEPLIAGADGQFRINWESFERSILPSTRLFLLCNPHNPTGRVFSRAELYHMAEICLDRKLLICSDEIHSDLIFPGHNHIPIASLSPEIANQTITLISGSKTFNLAGISTSAAIITNPLYRAQFRKGLEAFGAPCNLLGECAMAAAYTHCAPWLQNLLSYLTKNRDLLSDFVASELPGVKMHPPEGTFLGWLDCSGTGLDKPADFFLEQARVALNPGNWFGEGFDKFARINFGCPRLVLLNALDKIKTSLASI